MANLSLQHINKIYDNNVQAVFDFTLDVEDKEFIVFVGPSGCGKSTTLRMIAGLEEITSGKLIIDGAFVNNVPPKDRDIAMVFQSYALYPHMTVYDNMAFSLKLRKMPKEEIKARVMEAAKILGLENYLDRKPKALSGGQRQRVALGRAIVRHPKVFLMDEPLSNLDAKLRVQMRSEIIKIHEKVGATTIYVTHDQVEAMTMATRIVVMKDGYIQQIGSPKELYNHPGNIFVAGFIGSPSMNFFRGEYNEGKFLIDGTDRPLVLPDSLSKKLKNHESKKVILGIRPEDIKLDKVSDLKLTFEADVVELLGDMLLVYGYQGAQKFILKADPRHDLKMHDKVEVTLALDKIHFFDVETEQVIK